MQRLRGRDLRLSTFPSAIGLCQSDSVGIFNALNNVQERLLYCKEAGDESWYGTFAEIAFTVDRLHPEITLPREVARLELVDVCHRPVTVRNQMWEFLRFGNGRMPRLFRQGHSGCVQPEVYSRNNVPVQTDPPTSPFFLQAYATNSADLGKRVLAQGLDNNGNTIISQDGFSQITGLWAVLANPFVQWPTQFNSLSGIQKDVTSGPVNVFSMDPTTGVQTLLVTLQPQETTGWYRKYFFHPLPFNCCTQTGPNPCVPGQPPTAIAVNAIAKLELIPVTCDIDYTLIQSLQALIEEGMSWRYSFMDSIQSKQLEAIKHKNAVRLLNGQLGHYMGIEQPVVRLDVFGDAHLRNQGIGQML